MKGLAVDSVEAKRVLARDFVIAFLTGLLAAMVAHNAGIEWWRSWEPGDAFDVGVVATLVVYHLLRRFPSKALETRDEQG